MWKRKISVAASQQIDNEQVMAMMSYADKEEEEEEMRVWRDLRRFHNG